MDPCWSRNFACALLAGALTLNGGAIAQQRHAPRRQAGAEPFTTFHLLDRKLSALGGQSAALQKQVKSPHTGKVKNTRPQWQIQATQMGRTVTAIERLALRLRARYRGKAFATRLFGRLHARAAAVEKELRVVRSAGSAARAGAAASEVDKRIVELGLQYNAITGGYAALHCAPGEWTCCEPKRQGEAAKADACRWMCTKEAQRCRGFAGVRVLGRKSSTPLK